MRKNVSSVVNDGLCFGCGVCHDSCSKGCITIKHDKDGTYPIIDNSKCTECGICLQVCAGHKIDIEANSRELFEHGDTHKSKYMGYYHTCFSGYSTNYDIRYHSASGGCVSQFLIYLLEKNYIDGAVVVGFEKESPMTPKTFIARTPDDILAGRSSKYCSTSYERILSQIKKEDGKYAVVGLPCHIQSIRKYADTFKTVNNRIVAYFAIYCSSTRTMRSQDYLLYRYGIKKEDVKRFAYRDNGCLGEMVFEGDGGNVLKSVPYQKFWIGMRGFFSVPRCSLCIDHFGELADVSFGDIYIDEYRNDHVGVNSIVSRTSYWTNILIQAAADGYLCLEKISARIVENSQGYAKRSKKGKGVVAEFKFREILGKRNPIYDQPFVVDNIFWIDMLFRVLKNHTMLRIGRIPQIWWMIKKFF